MLKRLSCLLAVDKFRSLFAIRLVYSLLNRITFSLYNVSKFPAVVVHEFKFHANHISKKTRAWLSLSVQEHLFIKRPCHSNNWNIGTKQKYEAALVSS